MIAPSVGCHTMLFRFGLPSGACLELPIGQHISIKGFNQEGVMVSRQYTPTTSSETVGHFDVIIKIYPTGAMGNYLKNLKLGSMVPIKGPLGHLHYHGTCAQQQSRATPLAFAFALALSLHSLSSLSSSLNHPA